MNIHIVTLTGIALIIALWLAGGFKWRKLRIIGVPIVLGLVLGLKWGYIVGMASWIASNSIRLGYGGYDKSDTKMSMITKILSKFIKIENV